MKSVVRVLAIVAGAALTVALLPAQRSGGTTGGGTTGGGAGGGGTTAGLGSIGGSSTGNIGRPGSTTNSPTNPNSPFPGDTTRPIFLSGKVVLEDGTPPADFVVIERVCNGSPHAEARTDHKGYFSFQLGQSQEVFADASDDFPARGPGGFGNQSGGLRQSDLVNCEIRASLAGFRSDPIQLATHRYMDNPDLGTIILHRLANVEGLTTSATSALAPKDARKAFEKGLEAARKSKPDEAQKELEKAVQSYPKYASAWFELGRVYEQRDHLDEARKAYTQALAADSKYINPYERLYVLAFKEAKWQEVADTTDRVMRLNPYDFPNAFYYNAVANSQLNKLDLAEKSAREAVKLDTAHRSPRATYVLGIILAQKQNFSEAAEDLRAYLTMAPNSTDVETVRKQLAEIEKSAQGAQAKTLPQPVN